MKYNNTLLLVLFIFSVCITYILCDESIISHYPSLNLNLNKEFILVESKETPKEVDYDPVYSKICKHKRDKKCIPLEYYKSIKIDEGLLHSDFCGNKYHKGCIG